MNSCLLFLLAVYHGSFMRFLCLLQSVHPYGNLSCHFETCLKTDDLLAVSFFFLFFTPSVDGELEMRPDCMA